MIYRFSETVICAVVGLWKENRVLIDGRKVWLFAFLGQGCKGRGCPTGRRAKIIFLACEEWWLPERLEGEAHRQNVSGPRHHGLARSAREFWPKMSPRSLEMALSRPIYCISNLKNISNIVKIKRYKIPKIYSKGGVYGRLPLSLPPLGFTPTSWPMWR